MVIRPAYPMLTICVVAMWLLLSLPCLAQPGSPMTRSYTTVERLESGDKLPAGVTVVPPDSAIWLLPDSLKVGGELAWNADCAIGKSGAGFHLARARRVEDALVITLFRLNRDYVDQLDIWVWEGEEFRCKYSRRARHGMSSVPAFTTDQVLVLESGRLSEGRELRGYVNFRATQSSSVRPDMPWDTRKDWVESEVVVHGAFKVIIE